MSEAREAPESGGGRPAPAAPSSQRKPEAWPQSLDWLKRRDDPSVLSYLRSENDLTDRALRGTAQLRDQLYAELRSRIKEEDRSVPIPLGPYFYYTRTEEGQPYRVWARTRDVPDGAEELLLDENRLAAEHDFFRLGPFAVSPDHAWLAYGYDTVGSENYELVFKHLETGEFARERIPAVSDEIVWAEDSRTLFYAVRDIAMRPFRVLRHEVGTPLASDEVVYEERDEAYHVDLRKTRSRRFVLIESSSAITSETWLIDAHHPTSRAQCFLRRSRGIEYDLSDLGRSILVRTNHRAPNFRVLEAPAGAELGESDRADWREVIPHRPEVMISAVEAFEAYVVVMERAEGVSRMTVRPSDDLCTCTVVPRPEEICSIEFDPNPEFDASRVRYRYSSPITPPTVCELDVASGEVEELKRYEVPGFERSRYEVERRLVAARDGVDVPMTLVRRVGREPGPHPALLTGYGSYGISFEPSFASHVFSLVDRGFTYAIAHVRGGGEFGDVWHDQGKMLHKKNTFTDFIDCAEELIDSRETTSDLLAITGRSAGGLLMGAVTNQRPDLFAAVVAAVPFVDVLSTMMDPNIPLTVIEYEEWGDPKDPVYHDYIASYSPYDNVIPQRYPHMLLTAGLHDPRVQFWEPVRWLSRVRELDEADRLKLLRVDLGVGHMGPSDRFAWLEDRALEYAFVLHALGLAGHGRGSSAPL